MTTPPLPTGLGPNEFPPPRWRETQEWNAAQAEGRERRRAGRRTLGRFLCRWFVTILAGLGGGRLAEMAQLSALAHSLLGIACATFAAVVVESTTPLRPAPPPPLGLPGG